MTAFSIAFVAISVIPLRLEDVFKNVGLPPPLANADPTYLSIEFKEEQRDADLREESSKAAAAAKEGIFFKVMGSMNNNKTTEGIIDNVLDNKKVHLEEESRRIIFSN